MSWYEIIAAMGFILFGVFLASDVKLKKNVTPIPDVFVLFLLCMIWPITLAIVWTTPVRFFVDNNEEVEVKEEPRIVLWNNGYPPESGWYEVEVIACDIPDERFVSTDFYHEGYWQNYAQFVNRWKPIGKYYKKYYGGKKRNLENWLASEKDKVREQGGEFFLGLPDAWYQPPTYACWNGHISHMTLRSETRGLLCLECGQPVYLCPPIEESELQKLLGL